MEDKISLIKNCEYHITSFSENDRFSFGFDVGGTKVKCMLLNNNRDVVAEWSFDTTPSTFIQYAKLSSDEILKNLNIPESQVVGYGFGVPGPLNDEKTHALQIVNMQIYEQYPILEKIQDEFGKDKIIALNNDVEGALKGELTQFNDIQNKKVFMITLGTGLGGAYWDGENAVNVEPGHEMFFSEEELESQNSLRMCACNKLGHREPYCNASAVVKNFTDAGGDENLFSDKTKEILELAQSAKSKSEEERTSTEKAAIQALEQYKKDLAKTISLILTEHPSEAFIIGGGVSKSLLEADFVDLQSMINSKTPLCHAFWENRAGSIGNAVDVFNIEEKELAISRAFADIVLDVYIPDMYALKEIMELEVGEER